MQYFYSAPSQGAGPDRISSSGGLNSVFSFSSTDSLNGEK